jgi:hypothetical protein
MTMAVLHVISNVMKSGTERMLESVSPTIYPNCKNAGIFAFGAHSTYSAVLSSKGYEIFASNASARSLLALWKYGLILSIRKPKVIHIHIEQNFLAVVAIFRFFRWFSSLWLLDGQWKAGTDHVIGLLFPLTSPTIHFDITAEISLFKSLLHKRNSHVLIQSSISHQTIKQLHSSG